MAANPAYREHGRPREFTCVDCGRHIVSFGFETNDQGLCGMCVHHPGWFTDPLLCRLFHEPVRTVPPADAPDDKPAPWTPASEPDE